MDLAGKTAIVSGGSQGIGFALARALTSQGARVLLSDLSKDAAEQAADRIGAHPHWGDLRQVSVVADMVTKAQSRFGQVDMLFSNAGFALGEPAGPTSRPDSHWQDSWDLHVMAHVRATRLLLPEMLARRSGVLINVASAAGLLCQIGDAAYSATKHAAVSFAQSLAIAHGASGLRVSVVCPMYVATPLLGYTGDVAEEMPVGVITPDAVADATLEGLSRGAFLVCPHPEARTFFVQRATDTDRWIAGMQRLNERLLSATERVDPATLHRLISDGN